MNKFNKSQKIIFIISILIISVIIIYYVYYKKDENNQFISVENELISYEEENKADKNNINPYVESKIIIHITGSINKEGVYELPENSRISDAIEKAGGLRDDAKIDRINLAYILQDGMKIYIPSATDTEFDNDTGIVDNTQNFIINESDSLEVKAKNTKININKATQTELETLPGIGPSIALKIIKYRSENGKFINIEDIKNVGGIGNSKFEQIKDFICV